MVAIVTGNGLGLFNASNNILGTAGVWGRGELGQTGGRAYVNVVTGNLVLRAQDETLSGRGLDLSHLRTYNSLGMLANGLGTGWSWDGERTIALTTGALNQAGSVVTRTDGDGHQTTYGWDAARARYVATEGSGAHDSVVYDSASQQWIWTEGSTRRVERYAGSTGQLNSVGRLASVTDTSGNVLSLTYDANGRLSSLTDTGSGQKLQLVYATISGVVRLQRVETFELTVDASGRATGTVSSTALKQIEYGYDTSGRLTLVKTDLTPANTTDSAFYITAYNYDGITNRIASIRQSDGLAASITFASFTYDASGRVKTVTDASGVHTFIYVSSTRTEVTDAFGKVWSYLYDSAQRLIEVAQPAPLAGGAPLVTKFQYDADGNLTQHTDARGSVVVYQYDASGNAVLERDALGNTVTRTYDANNQALTETRYRTPDPDGAGTQQPSGAVTTRYVYDSQSRLRFSVSAEGRVTEQRYGTATAGFGLLLRTVRYAAGRYDVAALTPTTALAEAQLNGWVATQDKTQIELTQYDYDLRGNLARQTDHAKVDASGNGVLDAATSIQEYIYDGHGQLLQRIALRGAAREQRSVLSSFAYDGLGRQLSAMDANGTQTTAYDDGAGTITVTTAAGLTVLSAFDAAGRLLSITQSTPQQSRLTRYTYDAAGRVQSVQDPQGNRRFSFYDAVGRLQFTVDQTGAVVGYEYNANGQLTAQVSYGNRAATAAWSSSKSTLVLGAAPGAGVDLVISAELDRRTTSAYDAAGRLSTQTDAANTVTTAAYDGLSRVTSKTSGERVTRFFYDRDGRQVGVVDPLGYLTESKFDAAGRLLETLRYTTRSPAAVNVATPLWIGITNQVATGGQLFQYRMPAVDGDGDVLTYSFVGTPPSWLTLDASGGGGVRLTGTPPKTLTSYDVTVRAADGRGKTSDVTVRITVQNSAPTWMSLPDSTVAVNSTNYSLVLPAASDNESSAAQLTYFIDAGSLPPGLSFDAAARKISGVPSRPGTYTVTARVTDAGPPPLTAQESFTITVFNNGPTWPAVPVIEAFIGQPFAFTVPPASDPEGQPLTYSVITKPSWLSFNTATRVLSGTPPAGAGLQMVQLKAQDPNGAAVTLSFSINVIGNSPPSWAPLAAINATAGTLINYLTIPAVDPDGDPLTYSVVSGLPPGLSVSSSSGSVSGTSNAVGIFLLRLLATDTHGLSTENSISITLNNAVPVYHGGLEDMTVLGNDFLSWDLPPNAFSDGNGDLLTFTATGRPSWLQFNNGRFSGRVPAGSPGTFHRYTITVTASDGRGGIASGSFILTALPDPGDLLTAGPEQPLQDAGVLAPSDVDATLQALPPLEDVLAGWRPTNLDSLRSFQYYDAQGRLVGSVDDRGFLTETVYDAAANKQQALRYGTAVTVAVSDTLATLRTRAGIAQQSTTVEYDALGRIGRRIDADGTVTRNEYDSAGRIVREVLADGTTQQRGRRTRYDAFNQVTGTLGGEGDATLSGIVTPAALDQAIATYGTRYEYDSLGRRTRALDTNNRATLFFYDAESRLTHTVNAKGEVSETLFNAFGQTEAVRRYYNRIALTGLGGGANSALATLLQPDATKDERSSYEYDRRGLQTKLTDALGFITTSSYTSFGELARQVRMLVNGSTPRTTTTQFDYDLRGQLLARTESLGAINASVHTAYDAYGRVIRSIDAAGRVTTTSYQDSGRSVVVRDALNRSRRSEYDAFGRVLKQFDASGRATVYGYDDVARSITVTTPEGIVVRTLKNRHGETLSVIDGRSHTTAYEYDKDGRQTKLTDALGKTTLSAYDASGRLTQITDARGVITRLSYDELNRVFTRQVDPAGLNLTTTYEFDAFGHQMLVTEGQGTSAARVTRYLYDTRGQLQQVIVDPSGLQLSTRYAYDGVGNTVRVEQGTVSNPGQQVTRFEFDDLGRRLREIAAPSAAFGSSAVPHSRDLTTEYRYDEAGRLSRRIDANGQSTWYVYDAAGQLTETVNALGEVSRSVYDVAGRLSQTIRYVTRLAPAVLATFGDVVRTATPTVHPKDQRRFFVYDADGRQRFTVQAENLNAWSIAESRYDANGNVIETRRYDEFLGEDRITANDTASSPGFSVAEITAELTALGYDDANAGTLALVQQTRFAYDANNRLRFTVDGLGGVSEQVYDATGNVVSSIRYATLHAVTTVSESALNALVSRIDARNQVTHFAYDSGGRQRYTLRVLASDAQGNATQQLVTEQVFDSLGRVVQARAFALVFGALSNYSVATVAAAAATKLGAQDRHAAFAFDAAGRQIYQVEALAASSAGAVTSQRVVRQLHDALGRVIKTTAYATPLGASSNYSVAALDAAVAVAAMASNPLNRNTSFLYDEAGRQRFAIAADGAWSETLYDGVGQVTERRRFGFRLDPSASYSLSQLLGLREGRAAGDTVTRGERYTYDRAGRLQSTTDALGFVETNEYNALGQRTTYLDKNGGRWRYEYDRVGRVYDSYTPALLVQLSDESAPLSRSLQTRFYYDAFGNLFKQLEAAQTRDGRLTEFGYDRLGRQIFATRPGWYDPVSGTVTEAPAAHGASFTPVVMFDYDAFGNVVRNRIATGRNTYVTEHKTYDKLGRQRHDVDALNHVTAFTYNSFGEQTSVTRHSLDVGPPPGTDPWTFADLAAAVAIDLDARTLTIDYDNLGRKTDVRQPASARYFFSGANPVRNETNIVPAPATTAATTHYDYNVFGEIVHQAVKLDSRTQDTWHYFDVMGRETRTIVAASGTAAFHTAHSYDANGNLVQSSEYANLGALGSLSGIPAALPMPSPNDRISGFGYDARDQRTSIQRFGLRYTRSDGSNVEVSNGREIGTQIAAIAYDGKGQVISQSDALGNVTRNAYNALGQLVQVTEPARLAAGAPGDPFLTRITSAPITTFTVNAFGQIVTQVRTPGVDGAGNPIPGPTLVTRQIYDFGGNLISSTDANYNAGLNRDADPNVGVRTRRYDYAGRIISEAQMLKVTLGNWQSVSQRLERRYAYDVSGHQTDVLDVYVDAAGVTQQTGQRSVYNAFGEVKEERKVWGAASAAPAALSSARVATYEYDKAGHVITRRSADGVTQYYYNLLGQVTRQEQQGNNSSTDGTVTRISETGYDLLGRALIQRLPVFTVASGANPTQAITPVSEQSYDRWGNVLSRSQGGYVDTTSNIAFNEQRSTTTYEYNADNQVIAEHLPTVTVRTASGTSYSGNLTHALRYDLLGRAVQELDLVDDVDTSVNEAAVALRSRSKRYDAAGQLLAETDATGITTQYAYDAHGNRVGTRNAVGTIFVDTFDYNGNVLTHAVLRQPSGGGATEAVVLNRYQYDQANRRVVSSDVLNANTVYNSYVQYDERNLVLRQRTPHIVLVGGVGPVDVGIVTTYGYDALGNRTSQRDANGNGQDWTYSSADDFSAGQLLSITTTGARRTDYAYNDFGQVKLETYSGGPLTPGQVNNRTYAYFDNGLLKDVADTASTGTAGPTGGDDYWSSVDRTHYEYTVKAEQRQTAFTRTVQHDVGTYDNAGNLISVSDTPVTEPLIRHTTFTAYDVLGRMVSVAAPADQNTSGAAISDLSYRYDEFGNLRQVFASYSISGTPSISDRYYTYDAEGRMTIADGILQNGVITITPQGGTRISYDSLGRRATAESFLKTSSYTLPTPPGEPTERHTWQEFREEKYDYNDLSHLTAIGQRLNRRNGKSFLGTNPIGIPLGPDRLGDWYASAVRTTDTRGAVIRSDLYSAISSRGETDVNAPELTTVVHTSYRADGQLNSQSSFDQQGHTEKNNFVLNSYDGAAVLRSYTYEQGTAQNHQFTNTYTYDYNSELGGYKVRRITVRTDTSAGQNGSTYNSYDARGNLQRQVVSNPGEFRERSFSYNTDGQVLTKTESSSRNQGPATRGAQDYFYARGEQVGVLGTGSLHIAQFNNNYTPISAAYPGSSPGSYVVNAGDTLASIARAVFGDPQLWYLIADANTLGFQPNEVLPSTEVGRSYRVPNVVASIHNNANTFKPYDPSRVIGDATPAVHFPTPPVPSCGDQVGRILAVAVITAVSVVVSVYTGGVATAAIGSVVGEGLFATAVGAGVGGALGSVASQGVGIGLGVQEDFSGRQVLAAGLASGLGAYFGNGVAAIDNSYVRKGFGAVTDYLINGVSNTLVGLQPEAPDVLQTLGTQLVSSTGPSYKGALAKVAFGAVSPQSGWLFNDRSRDWVNIASQAVSAFTSVAVHGAIEKIRSARNSVRTISGDSADSGGGDLLSLIRRHSPDAQYAEDVWADYMSSGEGTVFGGLDVILAEGPLGEGFPGLSALPPGSVFALPLLSSDGVALRGPVYGPELPPQVSRPAEEDLEELAIYARDYENDLELARAEAQRLGPRSLGPKSRSINDPLFLPSADLLRQEAAAGAAAVQQFVDMVADGAELYAREQLKIINEERGKLLTVFDGKIVPADPQHASIIGDALRALQGRDADLHQAVKLLTDDELAAVLNAGVVAQPGARRAGRLYDVSEATQIIDAVAGSSSAEIKARVFDAGVKLLGRVGDSRLQQRETPLTGVIYDTDSAGTLNDSLFGLITSDPYGVLKSLAEREATRNGQSVTRVVRNIIEARRESILTPVVNTLRDNFERSEYENGVVYHGGALTAGYFVGAVGAAIDVMKEDRETNANIVLAIAGVGVNLATGGAGYSNAITEGFATLVRSNIAKFTNEGIDLLKPLGAAVLPTPLLRPGDPNYQALGDFEKRNALRQNQLSAYDSGTQRVDYWQRHSR